MKKALHAPEHHATGSVSCMNCGCDAAIAPHAPEKAPDGSPGHPFTEDGMDIWPAMYGPYGEQCADTDGMAAADVGVTVTVGTMVDCGSWLASNGLLVAGPDFTQRQERRCAAGEFYTPDFTLPVDGGAALAWIEAEVTKAIRASLSLGSQQPAPSASPIAALIQSDLARHTTTAPALPPRALHPLSQRGGLHCGPFA